jgi:uncharacterized protein YjaG (DUF416 family)
MNSIVRFDKAGIKSRLTRLIAERQVIFAVSCATRLFPGYLRFSEETGFGDPTRLQKALDSAWKWAQSGQVSDFQRIVVEIEPLLLDENTPFSPFNAAAEDAASAIMYVLEAILRRRSDAPCYAASVAFEAAGQEALRLIRAGNSEPGSDAELLNHPLVQTELNRQLRDLIELENFPDNEPSCLATTFRARAEGESAFVLAL